jgi:hypothetical protein
LILVLSEPIFNRFCKTAAFKKATRAILASFVGLLFYTAVKFGVNVPWDLVRVILCVVALIGLLKKVDVIYVVLCAALISLAAIR